VTSDKCETISTALEEKNIEYIYEMTLFFSRFLIFYYIIPPLRPYPLLSLHN